MANTYVESIINHRLCAVTCTDPSINKLETHTPRLSVEEKRYDSQAIRLLSIPAQWGAMHDLVDNE